MALRKRCGVTCCFYGSWPPTVGFANLTLTSICLFILDGLCFAFARVKVCVMPVMLPADWACVDILVCVCVFGKLMSVAKIEEGAIKRKPLLPMCVCVWEKIARKKHGTSPALFRMPCYTVVRRFGGPQNSCSFPLCLSGGIRTVWLCFICFVRYATHLPAFWGGCGSCYDAVQVNCFSI
ncbi:hypothetical protein TbgDal_VI4010 [Trypanosoma brucei gambiense DAL972]|uniref:Uncharacterized protein n=1 Tax=Trypanosoma brucei gambiense (strain MHOM/CI/86/DAL972) TaxID=679716 RepID=C9ZR93_TRYB9|nr:hypothetical protein TbgDal_VI4010 [Trypanosoma brucei gambiense DAL972]CBH11923.1 hypothetical protein TbgDal_VI4010 [Trypanosoma brucei gambiense DAL972]|eukprot:XP_011774208.1 hypothetical protein TbgDal_VI4010 [Trypanosoma brucei gambiense DAL972]